MGVGGPTADQYPHRFDVEGKNRSWHTAFYYLAEHIRYLSCGKLNHKELYALVGTDGRYVNHANPLVRKRTAGALSRTVHSKRYAEDMRSRYNQNGASFGRAAASVCAQVREARSWSDDQLVAYLRDECWGDVRRGLLNEMMEWRADFNLFRADQEVTILFDGVAGCDDRFADDISTVVLASVFYILAFGHMDFELARNLVDQRPTGALLDSQAGLVTRTEACLIKFSDVGSSSVAGSWIVPKNRLFTMGRYTDCDVVEINPGLSRLHCCIYFKGGVWYFEDMGSRNGSSVTREGVSVYDQRRDGARVPVQLNDGDNISLGGSSVHYWFGTFCGENNLTFASA